MNLPQIEGISLANKKVILRADLDIGEAEPSLRLDVFLDTIKNLLTQGAKVMVIAHKGRPGGADQSLSLEALSKDLEKTLSRPIRFYQTIPESFDDLAILENLRFFRQEEEGDSKFAQKLASIGDIYVNEAFAASHRNHASITQLPKYLPHFAGPRFAKEVEVLSGLFENPKRPLIFIISGVKKDKLDYVDSLKSFSDKVLIGGRLSDFIKGEDPLWDDKKVLIAKLIADKEDITIHSAENFNEVIADAETIVISGPLGKYEDPGHSQGTRTVFNSIGESTAFKIAGGGDTQKALAKFGLEDKINWISVGGGAMLEFLTKKTLPGIEALIN